MAACMVLMQVAGSAVLAEPFNFNVLDGEWARVDGDYTLRIQDAGSGQTADVQYFNPGNIHVSENRLDTKDGWIRLFVKLEDTGYPGSTYTLYYYFEKDVLVGAYYQAATGRTYEVIFERK